MRWGFATWMSDAPTGGNVYDRRLIAELLACGVDLHEHRVDGTWPRVSAVERDGLADLLTREPQWLIDAIVACGAPEVVTAAIGAGRAVVVLVHSFMSDEVWSSTDELRAYEETERTILRSASGVICTSRWSADRVARLYGRSDASVARPGSDPAPIATGTGPGATPRILALGTVCARKDQLSLVRALADVADLPWTARIVGAVEIEAEYAESVRVEASRLGLARCVSMVGPRTGDALQAEWDATDLLVLTSRAEAYGMVVVEALARGIPSIVTQGTGAEEAQLAAGTDVRPGAVVRPGDPGALAGVLNRWLTDHELRQQWRQAALRARSRLPAWESTTRAVVDQLRTAE